MISVNKLTKVYKNITALDSVSFEAKAGEIIALLGPNGAGKTTLMRLIMGYIEPTSGQLSILEKKKELNHLDSLAKIGYMPENCPLYSEMSVKEFLNFCADLRGLSKEQKEKNLEYVIETLSLKSVLNQKTETLSKGYKRRVGLGAAIIHKPQILVLDEPTEGLDPNQKTEFRNFIENYSKNNIIIISTHIMEEVEAIANRVLLLNNGKLIADSSIIDFKKMSSQYDIASSFQQLTKGRKK